MSQSLTYVREMKIPALLNDMVMHLLGSKPDDVLTALVEYLEQHPNAKLPAKQPPKAAPVSYTLARDEKSTSGKHTPAPPPAAAKPQTAPRAVHEAPKPQPAQTTAGSAGDDDMPTNTQSLLDQLLSSEKELAYLLNAALADTNAFSAEDRVVISSASANTAEMIKLTGMNNYVHTQVDVALDRVRSAMTDNEYFASKGFRLIHELEANEIKARAYFKALGVDLDSLSDSDRSTVEQAITVHREFLSLVDVVEEHQLLIAVKANGGSINESVATYFNLLSKEMFQACTNVKQSNEAIAAALPTAATAAAPAPVKPAAEKPKAPGKQAYALLNAIQTQEADFIRALAALEASDDVEIRALAQDAINSAQELDAIAEQALEVNVDIAIGGSVDNMSYDELRKTIHKINLQVAHKMTLIRRSHKTALSRAATTVTSKAALDAHDLVESLSKGIDPNSSAEAAQALALLRDFESITREVDTIQQAIGAHVAAH